MNTVSNLLETTLRHRDHGGADIQTDVANPASNPDKFADPSMEPMRALAWQKPNSVAMVDSLKPKILDKDDVIIKVTGSTICGSDLHLYHGAILQMKKDDILGHEFCGKVESVGPGIKSVKPGDRVVASFQIGCGECYYCKQKLSSQCERTNSDELQNYLYGHRTAGVLGYSHLTGGFAGGQAEYVRMPFGDANLLKLPDDVPDEKGLYLSDVLCTSYHCVVDTGVKAGDTVAIWGMGPIGLMAAYYAFREGASRVIGIDNNWRLEWCKLKLPKLETLDYSKLPSGSSVPTELRKMVDKGVDCALDCAAGEYAKGIMHKIELAIGLENDSSETLNEMILSVKKFGKVGITGVYSGYTNHFNIGAVMELGIRVIGNGQAPVHKYWHKLLDEIRSGDLDPTIMLSHRIDLEDVAKVYTKFDAKEDEIMKVFVQTKWSDPPAPGTPALTRF
ncbi:chaperonin 10-like protein [Mycena floridula]|nr:chaperonin 10-like protein [Mycena floridula]